MRTQPLKPFLVPSAGAVRAQDWRDGGGSPLLDELEHWDSAMDLELVRVVAVDTDRVRSDCRLGDDSELAVSATWHSNSTRVFGGPGPVELGRRGGNLEVLLRLTVEGEAAGGTIRLRTRLVLRHTGTGPHELSPASPGAILWSDEQLVALEGGAARFPTAVVDFATTSHPREAAWVLCWGGDRLHEPLLGDFRLVLNESHPSIVTMLRSGSSDARTAAVRSVLEYEVLRCIVHAALADTEFTSAPDQYEEGTVGFFASELIARAFPGRARHTLGDWQRDKPEQIDAHLQAYVGLLR